MNRVKEVQRINAKDLQLQVRMLCSAQRTPTALCAHSPPARAVRSCAHRRIHLYFRIHLYLYLSHEPLRCELPVCADLVGHRR
jgi:hypothetical protein